MKTPLASLAMLASATMASAQESSPIENEATMTHIINAETCLTDGIRLVATYEIDTNTGISGTNPTSEEVIQLRALFDAIAEIKTPLDDMLREATNNMDTNDVAILTVEDITPPEEALENAIAEIVGELIGEATMEMSFIEINAHEIDAPQNDCPEPM